MVERPSSPYRNVSLRHGTGRLVDGDRVPHPPRPTPPPLTVQQMVPGLIIAVVVLALLVAGLALKVAGVTP